MSGEATVNPDGSTTFEEPPVNETMGNETGGGEGFDGAEEEIMEKGIDPVWYLLAALGVFAVLVFLFRRRKKDENEDDFFSNLDGEKVSKKDPSGRKLPLLLLRNLGVPNIIILVLLLSLDAVQLEPSLRSGRVLHNQRKMRKRRMGSNFATNWTSGSKQWTASCIGASSYEARHCGYSHRHTHSKGICRYEQIILPEYVLRKAMAVFPSRGATGVSRS